MGVDCLFAPVSCNPSPNVIRVSDMLVSWFLLCLSAHVTSSCLFRCMYAYNMYANGVISIPYFVLDNHTNRILLSGVIPGRLVHGPTTSKYLYLCIYCNSNTVSYRTR
jgi:hypothetical protein